jgi:hypothetical protein
VVDKSGDIGDLTAKRTFLEVVEAEVGDVDITKSDVLVSVGRGIEDEENIELPRNWPRPWAPWSPARGPSWMPSGWRNPARWAPPARRSSPRSTWPAASAAFQHMGGIKGAPFIVAINKNVKAPIFQVADVGIVADILDFLPELTEAIPRGLGRGCSCAYPNPAAAVLFLTCSGPWHTSDLSQNNGSGRITRFTVDGETQQESHSHEQCIRSRCMAALRCVGWLVIAGLAVQCCHQLVPDCACR